MSGHLQEVFKDRKELLELEQREERDMRRIRMGLSVVTIGACSLTPVLSHLCYRAGLTIWEQEGWRGSELLLNAAKLSPKYAVLSGCLIV